MKNLKKDKYLLIQKEKFKDTLFFLGSVRPSFFSRNAGVKPQRSLKGMKSIKPLTKKPLKDD
ncbi:hypothetical protein OAK75_03060 [Bacteriovoracales bacterium]|nr:hypothetical protein [Bacteriovoracales bacterium]